MAGTTSTIPIQIGNTIIQFPNTGASPLWSPAIIQFAQLVAIQLQTVVSPFDIPPSVDILTTDIITNMLLDGGTVAFPNTSVRSFTFTYSIFRTTTLTSKTSTGVLTGVFNTTTSNWQLQLELSGDLQPNGQPYESFDINPSNQILLTLVPINDGTYTTGTISYSAKTELVVA